MSGAVASETTSASSPSITARAWRPAPPCDISMVSGAPPPPVHDATNIGLISAYSSRVGSYDTFRMRSGAAAAAEPSPGAATPRSVRVQPMSTAAAAMHVHANAALRRRRRELGRGVQRVSA